MALTLRFSIGRGAARVAGAPMTVAYGPADHAYEVAASAEGPVGRGGRSRPIASFGLFRAITVTRKGLTYLSLLIKGPTPNIISGPAATSAPSILRTSTQLLRHGSHSSVLVIYGAPVQGALKKKK